VPHTVLLSLVKDPGLSGGSRDRTGHVLHEATKVGLVGTDGVAQLLNTQLLSNQLLNRRLLLLLLDKQLLLLNRQLLLLSIQLLDNCLNCCWTAAEQTAVGQLLL
jgi:hypothetical protein